MAAVICAALVIIPSVRAVPLNGLRWLDSHVLHEGLKDTWYRLFSQESWSSLPVLQLPLDYTWLQAAGTPRRIGHALGASESAQANTLGAADAALASGLRVLEVDLWLDDQGEIRCHHGPPAPPPMLAGDCTFATLLERMVRAQAFLVLDIKSDFATTGARIVQALPSDAAAQRVVFQLYEPTHVALFQQWRQSRPLAGPMVTAYRAKRAVNHALTGARAAGIRAYTLPVERLPALSEPPLGMAVFVHPVHDCATWQAVQAVGEVGMFALTGLNCGQTRAGASL